MSKQHYLLEQVYESSAWFKQHYLLERVFESSAWFGFKICRGQRLERVFFWGDEPDFPLIHIQATVFAEADLVVLMESNELMIRWSIARKLHIPMVFFIRLLQDENGSVRNQAAGNPSMPPLVKLWLTSDYNKSISLEEFLLQTQGATNGL